MKKKAEGHENHERWMVSYADFLTLLFAVFVVLYSFAMAKQSDAQRMVRGVVESFSEVGFASPSSALVTVPGPMSATASIAALSSTSETDEVTQQVQGGGGVMDFGQKQIQDVSAEGSTEEVTDDDVIVKADANKTQGNLTHTEVQKPTSGTIPKDVNNADNPNMAKGDGGESIGNDPTLVSDGGTGVTDTDTLGKSVYGHPFDAIKKSVSNMISDSGLQDQVVLEDDGRWLTINISSGILFAQGSASILNPAKAIINEIAKALTPINNYIKVRGYTDNVFEDTGVYSNNWELSASRAIAVLLQLVNQGVDPNRLSIEGYGQYAPFYSNTTLAGRAQNRRVVIAVSRFAVVGRHLDVLPGDDEKLVETPAALRAGSGDVKVKTNSDGVVELDINNKK